MKKTIKLSIISCASYPSHHTNTQQVIKNASALAKEGLDTEVIVPYQLRSVFQSKKKYTNEMKKYYNIGAELKIRRFFTVPVIELKIIKIIQSLLHSLLVPFSLIRKKAIFETYRKFGNDYPIFSKIISKLSKRDNCIGIIFHSKHASETILKHGFMQNKITAIHNGYDPADISPVITKQKARKSLNLKTKSLYVTYIGNMQKNKGIESIIEVASRTKGINYLFVGGTEKQIETLKNYAKNINAKNLTFYGQKPLDGISEYLYASDILIIPPTSAPLEKYGRTVLPYKLFLYLAAKRIILSPSLPDVKELLNNKNSILVEPDNYDKIAKKLIDIKQNLKQYEKYSEESYKLGKKLVWEKRAKKIIQWINKVT